MKTRILLAVAGVLATGCGEAVGPGLSGVCVASLRIGSVMYSLSSEALGAPAPNRVVAEVARLVDCQDTLEPGEQPQTFEDGDSNTLPAGTKLYEVEGHSTSVRLAARPGSVWLIFVAEGG